ncbi:MAG: dihydroxyacetone kinase-like protein [Verrucomicrobiales bacterium]|jgi:dihydroxyacetone kinase-like protein
MRKTPKIINDPNKCASELLDGLVEAYDGEARKVGSGSIVMNDLPEGKVALLVGGGTGHEPIYHGLVGKNMADAAACGDIFAAPPPNIVLEATQAVDRGKGVMYLYGNYAGDVMNFDMGAELADDEDIEVKTVLIWDDVASAPPERKEDRRGIAGLVLIVKIAGAAATTVDNLDELVRITTKARDNTRSVGVAVAAGSIPATGAPTFELEDGKMGVGMGIHGEKGVRIDDLCTADEMAPQLLDIIFGDDLEFGNDDEVVLFINSLGATTQMELLIINRAIKPLLAAKGIKVYDTVIGDIVTCQEMAGLSISLLKLDDELKKYWDMPCQSVGYSKMGS